MQSTFVFLANIVKIHSFWKKKSKMVHLIFAQFRPNFASFHSFSFTISQLVWNSHKYINKLVRVHLSCYKFVYIYLNLFLLSISSISINWESLLPQQYIPGIPHMIPHICIQLRRSSQIFACYICHFIPFHSIPFSIISYLLVLEFNECNTLVSSQKLKRTTLWNFGHFVQHAS